MNTRTTEEQLAVALDAIVRDRTIRRYLAVHSPDTLKLATRAVEEFHRSHSPTLSH